MNPTQSIVKQDAQADKGTTRQIPREEWVNFFDTFTRIHEGWLASLEVMAPELGDLVEIRDRPLAGITAEMHRLGRDSIVIIFGRGPAHLTHMIQRPTRVWLKQTVQGDDEALEIEAAEAPTTLLRFRSFARAAGADSRFAWGE